MIPKIRIEDFNYNLPDERIAKYPLSRRDSSKLLIYKDGKCRDRIFRSLPRLLPEGALMIFNDTKVVPARLFFRRATGAHIEIFCLEPVSPAEYATSFASKSSCEWKCIVGNAKRWKDDILEYDSGDDSELASFHLRARLVEREEQTATVEFNWDGGTPFSYLLELCGRVPIPPYLNRDTEAIDIERYQTTYARVRGSVAAPTAGLHFTPSVLNRIDKRGIERREVCLHVGAGTFLPVKSSLVSEHPMHREPFELGIGLLRELKERKRKVVAVGTTSVRTLESLYYVGAGIIESGEPQDVGQWAPYERNYSYSLEESLGAIVDYLERKGLDSLRIGTRIIIVPGFKFRIVDAMVTNFHQPQSTLLLLISAFVGGDWHTIYDHAMQSDYRFLSYGDSSLLFRRDDIEFDSIRPYTEEEAVKAMARIARHPAVLTISKYFFPKYPPGFLARMLRGIGSIDEFQDKIMMSVVKADLAATSDGLSVSGIDILKGIKGRFLAMSNHRDIVLDPALIQSTIHDAGLPFTQICVGNNLLKSKLIEDLMRSNRMITVIRGISARELYLSSCRLSRFIRRSITTGDASVWIAQREGRTKNGIDCTEQGLLKMFDLSGENGFVQNFRELNILPISISYEYESCDAKKARELLISRYGKYVKKPNEDTHSILTGIRQKKGRIHITIGQPLSDAEIESAAALNGNDRYQALMRILDRRIISGYKLFKTNYMGFDLMNGTSEYLGSEYSRADLEDFIKYTEHKLSKIERKLKRDELRKIFYGIYGNPVASMRKLQDEQE